MNWHDFDELWRERHDPAKLQQLKILVGEWADEALNSTSENEYAWWWRGARMMHFGAMQAEESGNHKSAVALFTEGAGEAKRAVAVNRFGVEGHFWLGVNALEAARRKNVVALGTSFGAASKSIEQAMKIDEAYHFGGPVRVWGRIQQMKPLILGGNLDNALASYRRALQIAPENSTTLLYYAQALWADRRPKLAREACEKIIAAPDDAEWRWEQTRDRKIAATLLAEINRARDT